MGLDCRQALPPSPAPALTWEGCASRSFQMAELPVGRLGAPGQGLPSCRVQSRGGRASRGLSAQALPSAGPTRRGWRPSWAFPGPSHGVPATRLLLGFLVPLSIKGASGRRSWEAGPRLLDPRLSTPAAVLCLRLHKPRDGRLRAPGSRLALVPGWRPGQRRCQPPAGAAPLSRVP